MNIGPVSPIATISLTATQPLSAVEPTAQQVARFEQQLQLSAEQGRYTSPGVTSSARGVDFQPLVHYAGQLSDQFRVQFDAMKVSADTRWLEPQQEAAVRALQDASRQMCRFGVTTLHFQFLTKGVQVTNDSARSLIQQA